MGRPSLPPLAVIGGGLCGGLAALALARRGFAVTLLAPAATISATALSYGALGGPGAWQAWGDLERLYGPLGLRGAALLHHSGGWLEDRLPAGLRAAPTRLWGLGRVDPPNLLAALPRVLALNGVRCHNAVVQRLEACAAGWRLAWQAPEGAAGSLEVPRVVLAAGAGSRDLWPALPQRLRASWAGVLLLADVPATRWTREGGRGRVVQPRHWQRPSLEAGAAGLAAERWIVDAGLAPRDRGLVVGQISLVRPDAAPGEPPDPAVMEARLRQGLAALDPELASLAGAYHQVPVSFCIGGEPLVGPVAAAPGLWAFTGFSAAFSRVPRAAVALASALAADAGG
ncbi:MAG: FAD-dependent oxidoreductase [Cyanobacteriota bacterium]|nr:FAD-dependent oxidoreductase [Cyanobacteriota bacterium]